MNWDKLKNLLKGCEMGDGAQFVPTSIPMEYAKVLQWHNGIEGFVGKDQYLILWRAEQIDDLNASYAVADFLPGVLLVGTDGGDTGFGIDARGAFVSTPLIGMSPEEMKLIGWSFDEFIELMTRGEGLEP